MTNTTTLPCPTCGKTIEWSEEFPHRPFCSKRCQQIDFGDWALEKHSIPGEPAFDEDLDEQGGFDRRED